MHSGLERLPIDRDLEAQLGRFCRVGLACTDVEGRLEFANERWREIAGLGDAYVAGASWLACVHPEDRARVAADWRAAAERGEAFRAVLRVRRPDGSIEVLGAELAPCNRTGGDGGWIATLVSDGRPELAEEEELFRQLTLNIREVFWLTDWRTRRVLFVSPVYETTWKRSCRSLYEDAASWSEPIHPEDKERVVAAFSTRAETGGFDVEYRIVWPDGSVRWIYDRAFPIRDETGEVVRMAGISEDVTERKRTEQELEHRVHERTESLRETSARLEREVREHAVAEHELRETERRFRQLAENITEVFWLAAGDLSRVLYVSPAYERVWGRSAQSLYDNAKDWMEAILPEDRARVHEVWERDVRRGQFDVKYRIHRPDGSLRWIHDRGFCVHDDSGALVRIAGLALDITERVEAELQMAAYQEKLRAMASELVLTEERERRRLALDLHDGLNQVITLAKMKVATLRRSARPELAVPLGEIGDLIDQADRAARSLTFQLSPPVLYDFGLEAAVEWLAEDVQRTYGLTVRVCKEVVPMEMDEKARTLAFRVVRELLINVAKHARAECAEIRIRRLDRSFEVAVADDGCAFAVEESESKGFGLFSIRERLHAVGGEMRIAASPGKGTTVLFECPLKLGE